MAPMVYKSNPQAKLASMMEILLPNKIVLSTATSLSLLWFGLSSISHAETIQIVVRTFIPKEHPSKPGYMLPVPGDTSKTMLPDAPLTAQCFGTDNRSFSTEVSASARFGGLILFDTSTGDATFSETTGITNEYDCHTGTLVCTKVAGVGGFSGIAGQSGNAITFDYSGEASNPCLTLAPDIEFSGTVTVDTISKTVSIDGKVDVFPSFEAFVVLEDGIHKPLYNMDPKSGATPEDLVTSPSGGSRAVSGSVEY